MYNCSIDKGLGPLLQDNILQVYVSMYVTDLGTSHQPLP